MSTKNLSEEQKQILKVLVQEELERLFIAENEHAVIRERYMDYRQNLEQILKSLGE